MMDEGNAKLTQLRRDTPALLGSGGGLAAVFVALTVGIQVVNPHSLSIPAILLWYGPVLCFVAISLSHRVVLSTAFLEHGSRVFRKRLHRRDIECATEGGVRVARGARVPGVLLHLKSGDTVELDSSAFLRSPRREKWIQSINDWLAG